MSRNPARKAKTASPKLRSEAKSIRFTTAEIMRIEQAAKLSAKKPSDFIRDAVSEQCQVILREQPSLFDQMSDLIGIVDVPMTLSDKTGEQFADMLTEQHLRKQLDDHR